jgi:gliding motility-associated-like protein
MICAVRLLCTNLLFILLFSGNAYASHIVGLDLFYTHVTGNTYKITLIAYGDCGPASSGAFATLSSASPVICIYNGNTSVASISLAIQAPSAGVEITPVCPADSLLTQCTNPTYAIPGIKKFVYSANYTVPTTSAVWRFLFTGNMGPGAAAAGRASAITNILSGTTSQLVDTLNNTVYSNSNAALTTVPVPFFCLNNNDSYNPGAVDPDTDSLSFALIAGMNGSTNCTSTGSLVSYLGSYSGTNPLGVLAGSYVFDSRTGQISFNPNILQRALVVYNVREFRGGTFVGSCQREMTFLVLTCTGLPPTGIISSSTGGTLVDSTHFKTCQNSGPLSLTINPTEADTANKITVTASGLPAGSTFTVVNNGTNHPNCTFSWTSTGVAPGTYIFYVTFTDNACPVSGTQTRAFTVTISPLPAIHASGGATLCAGASTVLSATGGISYTWSPSAGLSCTACSSTTATPSSTTLYTVTGVDANGCQNTDTVRVRINSLPVITAGPSTSYCLGGSALLSASGGVSYSWSPGTGLSCTTCSNPTANPAVTTVYTVTGTDVNGCQNKATVTITVNPLPTISAGPGVAICAGSSAVLTATGGSVYSWSPSTGLSCSTCASPTASPSATTTYTVIGTNTSGCSNTATVTVSVNPLPTIGASSGVAICAGSSAVLTATGGSSYTWSPSTGLSCSTCASTTATPGGTTTYTVTGTNASGCSNSATVTVIVNSLPVIGVSPGAAICAGSTTTLTATGGTTYSWSPSTGLSCATCATTTASPAATTTYTVTGTNAAGCSNRATVIITVNSLPAISAGPGVAICAGSSAVLTATGGSAYSWSPSTGLSCSTCASPTASPSATTTYTVIGTNASGCSNTSTVTVSVNPLPTISAGPGVAICAGSSTTLTATGGSVYSWAPSTGLSCTTCASPTATPAVTTTYTVTGINAAGCSNRATVTVTVNPLPVVGISPGVAICAGSSTTLTAAGGATYSWSPTTGLSCATCATTTASPPATTIYTVIVTSAAGCNNMATVVVTVNPLPSISAGPGVSICPGLSTTLTATGGSTYSWSPSTGLSCSTCASTTASPAATTTYTVIGTNAYGCHNTATVTVTVNSLPAISVGPGVAICAGSSTVLTASGGVTYSWLPSTGLSCSTCASTTATPAATTTYTVTGIITSGCQNTATVTVTVNPLPAISAGPGATICAGAAATLTASGGSTYSWSPATGMSCATCATTTASPAATTTYTVTGTNSYGCSNNATVTVTVNPLPSIHAIGAAPVCTGTGVAVTGTGGSSYTWSPGSGLSCTACTTTTASPTVTTVYTITGTDANGCRNTDTFRVTVYPLPVISAGPPASLCFGSFTTLTPSGGVSYVWSPGTGLSCTSCTSPVSMPSGTIVYTVTGTDAYGCSNRDTVRITVHPLPAIDAGPAVSICAGTTTVLSPAGGVSYVWSPGTGLSCTSCTSPVAGPASTTIYTVTGTDAYGCTNTDTVSVTVKPLPAIRAGAPASVCSGATATLTATGGVSYVWASSFGLSCYSCTSPVASPTVTTVYTVTGTAANGCQNSDTVRVTVNPLPAVSAGSADICIGSGITLSATGGISYTWTPRTGLSCTACSSPSASPGVTTVYTVTGISAAGCANTDTLVVNVHPLPTVTTSGNTTKCFGNPYSMFASGGGTYTWVPAGGLSCSTCGTTTATPSVTTTYTVTVTTLYGCSRTAPVTVSINPLPVLSVSPSPVKLCVGRDTAITVRGALTYTWSPAAGLSATTGSTVVAAPGVTTVYIITGTDANNCSSSIADSVLIGPLSPPPSVVSPVNYCLNDNAAPLSAAGTSLLWYTGPFGGIGSPSAPIPATSSPGSKWYYVSQNSNGCEGPRDSVNVTIYEKPKTDFDWLANIGCNVDLVTLTNHSTNVTRYLWTFADGTTDTAVNPIHRYQPVVDTSLSWIKLVGYNPGCPADSAVKAVKLYPAPASHFLRDITTDQAIPYGTSVQLDVRGGWFYYWKPDDGTLSNPNINDPIATPLDKTTYVVYSYNHAGCLDSAQVTIDVITTQEVIPSAFTPNGDGLNDIFHVVNLARGHLVDMMIYNRWGQLVCHTQDNEKGWDGTFQGVPQDLGVFNYYIIVERENHAQVTYKGNVTLVR